MEDVLKIDEWLKFRNAQFIPITQYTVQRKKDNYKFSKFFVFQYERFMVEISEFDQDLIHVHLICNIDGNMMIVPINDL